jgi:cation transport ATPase
MSRNQPASYLSAKPIVATNNPMAIKDRETPPASVTGPHLCSEAAAPSTIGSNGSTQGDRIESTPARNASPKPTTCRSPLSTSPAAVADDPARAGLGDALRFRGDGLVLFALSSIIYVYGGRPFLTGFLAELRSREPGMMTLVAVAILVAFFYSAAQVRSR